MPGVGFSTRRGGVSPPPYDSLNLGLSTGDDPACVAANRRALSAALGVGEAWARARQVHGAAVVVDPPEGAPLADADAVVVREPGRPAAVLVADCVPIALVGDGVAAAVHAGWRGLCAGVIEAAVAAAAPPGGGLTAWIGPSIGPCCYEVGPEVPAAFAAGHPGAPPCTSEGQGARGGAPHFDLRAAAAWVLEQAGVTVVNGVGLDGAACGVASDGAVACTACDPRFFSHRRDARGGSATGRQALLVWLP